MSHRHQPFNVADPKVFVVYEDHDILVVDKPFGLLTIRDEAGHANLYSLLYDYVREERERDSHLFVVHRLDRDTSGLLVFAKNLRTKYELQACFEDGSVERKYEAVAVGNAIRVGERRRLVIYLDQDRFHRVFVTHKGQGKECVTDLTCLARKGKLAYLEISILTGRRNQIRLTLAQLGMPVLGDVKYGGIRAQRLFLNAYELRFPKDLGLKKDAFSIPRRFEGYFGKDGDSNGEA